ncbi:uncharacterized protein LOC123668843 [Melitaea cinxia]|uniref:uncharacterized protein LOC123668843 n=1 Tax=Melitaea cinxia TaxID=113334 RepID=UPI001E27028C|nr:uncharacterized protein LOC123668843 [Melitaea cinxia]
MSVTTLVICTEIKKIKTDLTAPKDMYIVRATVYQVGILTNQTNETFGLNPGHQESITIYHNNGSNIDLSAIPDPLMTNVTAEKVIGVAPVTNESVPWGALNELVSIPNLRGVQAHSNHSVDKETSIEKFRRDVSERPVEIIKGTAVIPSEAGVQSIGLPPLLTLNKNLSTIPVPIPNISIVSYAKVNTVVHSTD